MIELNKPLSVDVGAHSVKTAKSRFSIGAVIILACLGLVLHVSVLLLVLQSRRGAEDRETEVRRREVAVEGLEARRTGLQTDISSLENQRIVKRLEADDATKAAEDLLRIKADLDRVAQELLRTKELLEKAKTDLNVATAGVTIAKANEGALRQASSDLQKDQNLAAQRRDALRNEIAGFDLRIPELKRQASDAETDAAVSRKRAEDAARQRVDRDGALNDMLKTLAQKTAEVAGLNTQKEFLTKEEATHP